MPSVEEAHEQAIDLLDVDHSCTVSMSAQFAATGNSNQTDREAFFEQRRNSSRQHLLEQARAEALGWGNETSDQAGTPQPSATRRSNSPKTVLDGPVAKRVRRNPEHILSLLTENESTFTRKDIAKALNDYVDEPDAYHQALATIVSSSELIEVQPQ